MIRRIAAALGLTLAVLAVWTPPRTLAFSGFGAITVTSTYGQQIRFQVDLPGGAPDRLELLMELGSNPDGTLVAPVEASGTSASYVWDTAKDYLTPNTPITYRWRATTAGVQALSPARTFRYADNRAGLDWQSATIGLATVHWYGDAQAEARRLGDLSSGATSRAETTLGHRLDGPIDIFVYQTRDEFFGALGPGAREWTGAATFPEIRTVFMWLGGGPSDYLDTALIHEVTHVVFGDATRNPYHQPPSWLNEGFATWSEQRNADAQAATVRREARSGLFSFSAITGQFPIGERGSSLSYAEGTTMVARIISSYGEAAMARIAAAYRAGATDAEALQAGTGVTADRLYADYFRAFGAAQPQPVPAATIQPSIVRTAAQGASSAEPGASAGAAITSNPGTAAGWPALAAGAILLIVLGAGIGFWIRRRGRTRATGDG